MEWGNEVARWSLLGGVAGARGVCCFVVAGVARAPGPGQQPGLQPGPGTKRGSLVNRLNLVTLVIA